MSAPDLFVAHAEPSTMLPFAIGYRTRTDQLDGCALAQTDFVAGLMPAAFLEALAKDCLRMSNEALAGMPLFGVAYVAQAASLASLGDDVGFSSAMANARTVSPQEGWLASRRLSLAVRNFSRLDTDARAALLPDIVVLVSTSSLRRGLAQAYVANPEARAWIEAGVEAADEGAQAAFLSAIRSVSGT